METKEREHRARLMVAGALLLALCAAVFAVFGYLRAGAGRGPVANTAEVVAAVRDGLREHSQRITVRFSNPADLLDGLPALAEEWIEAALAETENPAEGDYIRYQCGGYEITCSREGAAGDYSYAVSVVPNYYMTLAQETAVTEALSEVMEGFGLDAAATDYEKLRASYDYVCGHIRYDVWNRRHRYHALRSTAYAGLVRGFATCQGYCVTLYRMLRTEEISCRIVTGMAQRGDLTEYHAWLIAELDGRYYALDPTWDAGQEEYMYFLRGSADFPDHAPEERFLSETFAARYPMAETAYAGGGAP